MVRQVQDEVASSALIFRVPGGSGQQWGNVAAAGPESLACSSGAPLMRVAAGTAWKRDRYAKWAASFTAMYEGWLPAAG